MGDGQRRARLSLLPPLRLLRPGSFASLVAVVGGQLVALDLARGTSTIRAADRRLLGGALARSSGRPPCTRAGRRRLALGLVGRLAHDRRSPSTPTGAETLHQAVAASMVPTLPDGGTGLGQIPPHIGTLVDPHGDVAFALPSGELGVVTPAGTVDLVTDVCSRFGATSAPRRRSGFIRGGPTYAGMAPAAPSAVVIACGSGVVARIDSDFARPPLKRGPCAWH